MRIAEILIEPKYPIKTSGEIVIENLIAQIKQIYGNKYDITIIKRSEFKIDSIVNGIFSMVETRIIRSILIFLLGVIILPKINTILKNFDVVIINGYFTAVFLFPYLIIKKKKSIYCPHTNVKPTKINAWLMNFFDAVVFLSDYNRQELINKNKKLASKTYVIYNFVQNNKVKIKKNIKKNSLEYLFVGRAVEVKRPWLFIESIIEAVKLNRNIKATMVISKGSLENKIKEMIIDAEKKYNCKISLFQNVKRTELENIYNKADVFVFTSTQDEGFGVVLLEAMQHGLPIICTDHPKFKEILRNSALYFNDKESLVEKILKLSQDNKLYSKYKSRSLKRFHSFSPQEITKKWIELFNKLEIQEK